MIIVRLSFLFVAKIHNMDEKSGLDEGKFDELPSASDELDG